MKFYEDNCLEYIIIWIIDHLICDIVSCVYDKTALFLRLARVLHIVRRTQVITEAFSTTIITINK